ncbi:MAG: hypothetical protein Q9157_007830 [Trypethelium eluteriae]
MPDQDTTKLEARRRGKDKLVRQDHDINSTHIQNYTDLFPEISEPHLSDHEVDVEGPPRKAPRQNKSTFLRTQVQLNPLTPANSIESRDSSGNVVIRKGKGIYMGELGTLEIIRSNGRGAHLARLKSHKFDKIQSAMEKPLIHKERLDPLAHSGNIRPIYTQRFMEDGKRLRVIGFPRLPHIQVVAQMLKQMQKLMLREALGDSQGERLALGI